MERQGTKRWMIAVMVVILLIIGVRVGMNLMAKSEQAQGSGRGRVASVTAGHPLRQRIEPRLRFSATLDPIWQADVAAKVDGRVERVLVEEGERVAAGDALALLEQRDTAADLLSAEGAYAEAEARLNKAAADEARQAYLFAKGAVSKEEMDNARFARENAAGALQSAQGRLALAESKRGAATVTTPRDGIVQKRYYQEGYYAKAGTALFRIADLSTLSARIAVPEGEIRRVAVGGAVTFTIPSLARENQEAKGRVARVSPVAEGSARTFEVEVEVDNADGRLFGGVYAEARIEARPLEDALTVPLSAIVMRDDQRTVYVIEDGIAVRRVLTTGYIGEDVVEVLAGVTEGDEIITGGLNKVREGAQVRVVEGAADK
ncbi:MAG: efflux RND transporter periplasmic adaptor subunit [Schwartzia sp. (in: firmicutes)]